MIVHKTIAAMKWSNFVGILFLSLILFSCQEENSSDATGTFEAVETIIPAKANGILQKFAVEEGQKLEAGSLVGTIDTTKLHLQKRELQARIASVLSKKPNVAKQLAALRSQLQNVKTNQERISNLFQEGAATQKQLDDAHTKVEVVKEKISATESSLQITTSSLGKSTVPLSIQIAQIEERLQDHLIINPLNGKVLETYAEPYEMASRGKPLYKIADLSSLILRAYVTGNQFATLQLGQKVNVKVDDGKDSYRTYEGIITWISDEAEFTPKTIQTKEERANLVYAIKIKVKNDGYLKIGMYGEVEF